MLSSFIYYTQLQCFLIHHIACYITKNFTAKIGGGETGEQYGEDRHSTSIRSRAQTAEEPVPADEPVADIYTTQLGPGHFKLVLWLFMCHWFPFITSGAVVLSSATVVGVIRPEMTVTWKYCVSDLDVHAQAQETGGEVPI